MFTSSRKTSLTVAWDGTSSGLPYHRLHCLALLPDCEPHEGRARSALKQGSVLNAQHRACHRWTHGAPIGRPLLGETTKGRGARSPEPQRRFHVANEGSPLGTG